MVFKSLPSNQHAFSLGSEPFMAPAVQFMKARLKTLDFCQVGRQSCLRRKGQESCTSHRGRASSLQATAVPGAINFCLWLWLKVKWVCHLYCPTMNKIPLTTYLQWALIEWKLMGTVEFPRPFADEGASLIWHGCHELQELIFFPQVPTLLPGMSFFIPLHWPWTAL